MLDSRIHQVKQKFIAHLQKAYNVSLPQLIAEQPPKIEMGDLAFPFCFELSKILKKSPRQLAMEIRESIGNLPGINRIEVAGPGYLNVFFARGDFFRQLFQDSPGSDFARSSHQGKVIVEHTNINPNKAAHIGHLRNAVLGDTFARMMQFRGESVEIQNYIDDTGVQVADVVVGFQHLAHFTLEQIQAIPGKFDYYCWDLYARVSSFYEQSPDNLKLRADTLQWIEKGHNPTAEIAHYVAHRIVQCHLNTMERLGILYDLLPKESDILHLKFWDHAFELLKKRNAIHFETSGKNKGCWVMRGEEKTLAESANPGAEEDKEFDEDKIIVRSNGTVTYVGKDIAYQLWKLGLLGMDFYYHPFRQYADGHTVFMTNSERNDGVARPHFGGGSRVYNVIDSRQSYLQNIVVAGLRALGYHEQADRSTHFSYEMVALSPQCCEDLGIRLSDDDRKRPYIEVSGRKGLGVKADDLLDTLLDRSTQEVRSRHPESSEAEIQQIGSTIAISAVRYFLLKYTRNSVIAFDFKEALSFEGETGPYAQYAVVRARNIFRKVYENDPSFDKASVADFINGPDSNEFLKEKIDDEFWKLIYLAGQLEFNVNLALDTAEPAVVAKYLFSLAQSFNNFYHKHRIKEEPDPAKKRFLLALTRVVSDRLEAGLRLLGIAVPEMM
ncbi:MAG: arginine--tRNA ligase [Terriglobia bacterium]